MTRLKFEESDAYLFLKAMEQGGDAQVARHFVASMRQWDKSLVSARSKPVERE